LTNDATNEAVSETTSETPGAAPVAPAAEAVPDAELVPSSEAHPETPRREEEDDDEPQAPLDPEAVKREALDKHFLDVVEFEKVRDIVARHCSTELGRKVLRRMKPLRSREQAQLCLEQTDEVVKLLHERERLPLADLHDAGGLVRRAIAASRPLEPKELRRVVATLDAARAMRDLVVSLDEAKYPRLKSLARHLDPVPPVEEAIRRTIDARGEVRDDSSERLASIRQRVRELKTRIESMLAEFSRQPSMAKALQNPRPVFRGGRMVLAVKAANRGELPGILQDRSKTGSTVFVEPEKVVPLGNELQDLSFEESTEITRILWDVTRVAMDHKEIIERTTTTLGWIDFTHAKARFMGELDLSIPELADDGRVELINARHPILLDMAKRAKETGGVTGEVVPITVRLGDVFDMLVVTGPNTGGKTVALKTVGLAAVMAQCGLPIAASKGSKTPIFQAWFADIGDEQSIAQSLSTFSAHLARLKEVLAGSSKDTLVLVDELGAGTDPLEGAALGRASLEKILASGARAMVTTHLGSLKQFAFTNPRAENGAMTFDHETLKPTYRLILGQPGNSNAISIAKRLGLDPAVVARADELLKSEDTRPAELIDSITKIRTDAEAHRERADSLRRGVEAEKRRLEEERHKLEAQRSVVQKEADNQMDERFSGLKRAIKVMADALKNAPTPYGEHVAKLQSTVDELLSHTPFEQKRREFAKTLKKGDPVFLISLGGTGTISRINKEKGMLTVLVGALPIETTFDNVSWIEGRAATPPPRPPRPAPVEGQVSEVTGERMGARPERGGRPDRGDRGDRGGRGGPPGGGRGGPPGGGRGGPGGRDRGGRGGRDAEASPTTPYNVFGSSGADNSGPPGAFGSTGVKPVMSPRQGGGGGRGGRGGRGGPRGAGGGEMARRMGPGGATRPVPPSLHAPWKPPGSDAPAAPGAPAPATPPPAEGK
jgi:DNA mismatch repair protein MutS2